MLMNDRPTHRPRPLKHLRDANAATNFSGSPEPEVASGAHLAYSSFEADRTGSSSDADPAFASTDADPTFASTDAEPAFASFEPVDSSDEVDPTKGIGAPPPPRGYAAFRGSASGEEARPTVRVAPRLPMGARGLMSLLFHGDLATEVIEVGHESGLFARLDAAAAQSAWVELGELAEALGFIESRLYKLLDALEAMLFVERLDPRGDEPITLTRYRSVEPLAAAATQVVGRESLERDRRGQPWGALHGRLHDVLRGADGIPAEDFSWPPSTPAQVARFARSMAAGVPPIAESFRAAASTLFDGLAAHAPRRATDDGATEGAASTSDASTSEASTSEASTSDASTSDASTSDASTSDAPIRVLDVGGGNGTLARALVALDPRLHVDVYELPELEPLARAAFSGSPDAARLGFRSGDAFLRPLPEGYDAILFVRILHDVSAERARELLAKAHEALRPGGKVIVCEELRSPERAAVQFFWSYFLVGVDACSSRLREWSRYGEWLRAIGFVDVGLVPGPFDLGHATKR